MNSIVDFVGARTFPRRSFAQTQRLSPTVQKRPSAQARRPNSVSRLIWVMFCASLCALLYFGWINRNERHWVPESGVGYWLGIAGSVVMLALLVYPLRKRFRSLRILGPVPVWFRLHMAFGLLGPSLILLHCNYRAESLNANVALNAMLIVAGSGLIGRFLYSHIHSTLSGRRLAAATMFEEVLSDRGTDSGNQYFSLTEGSLDRLSFLTKSALASPPGLFAAVGHASLVRRQSRQFAQTLRREIDARHSELNRADTASRRQLKRSRRVFERDVSAHLVAVRKAAQFTIYERLFSLWHFLHLPLFLMLVIAAIAHVVAVHLY